MTFTQYLTDHLTNHGLWPNEAGAVIDQWLETPPGEPMQGRMSDHTQGYPDAMMAVLMLSINSAAVQWIDANKPKHFARPMFVPESQSTKAEPNAQ